MLGKNYNFFILLFTILSGLTFVVLVLQYFTKIPKYIFHRILTPTDSRVFIEYDKYFIDEIEGFNRPYINRIEEQIERDVINEVKEFLDSSYQILIISGESGVGKTRLAIEISKSINSRLKFWRKCLFVNLRNYKDPKDIKEKLNKELLKNITLVFDDYQYNMDVFNEVKNIALKRNSKLIITTRSIFHDGLKERIGQAGIKTIELHRMNVEGILTDISDEHLKEKIIRISEGIPSIALLALNYVKNASVQEQSFFHGTTSKTDFFNKIIHDFEDETSKEFVKFLAVGALIGGITQEDKFEDELLRFLQNGHIIKTGNKYRITHDVLSDYLIDHTFFNTAIKKSYFVELAKYNNGEHILEILNSVIRLNDNQNIYRMAADLLLKLMSEFESPDINQKKTRIRMGISAYEGFENIGLVVENLGEFWTDCEVIDDANDLVSLGIFLYKISKFDEAKICWEEAGKYFHEENDRSVIASTLFNVGNIHQLKGEYEDALEKYNDALEIQKELGDRSGIAMTNAQLGVFYREKENLLT
jgi:tetratricopeptide (TPR) repeat protein